MNANLMRPPCEEGHSLSQDVALHLHHAELLAQDASSARCSVVRPGLPLHRSARACGPQLLSDEGVIQLASSLGNRPSLVEDQAHRAGPELVGEPSPLAALRIHLRHATRLSWNGHGSGSSPETFGRNPVLADQSRTKSTTRSRVSWAPSDRSGLPRVLFRVGRPRPRFRPAWP